MKGDQQPSPSRLTFRYFEKGFWWLFILLPLFSGLLAYSWLPNEAFDEKYDTIISSHEICHEVGEQEECGEMADTWKDTKTGKTYSREEFSKHRNFEQWRMLCAWFGYGLLGCFFYAYARWRDNKDVFFQALGKAVCVDVAISLLGFFMDGRG